jgi:CarboxypepD_reg-like domain
MRLFLLLVFCGLSSVGLFAQDKTTIISGIVLDSASQLPLPYTAIQVKRKNQGMSTKDDGSFSIECTKTDTLVFSRLGHKSFMLPVRNTEGTVKIFLAEDSKMLKEITVYDRLNIPGMNDWKKELPSNANIKLKEQPLAPTQNDVATFGPGVTYKLNTKDNTAEKREALAKTDVYRTTINSSEVKKELMSLYKISEDTYYQKLEKFNKAYPEAAYLTNKDEIVTMLIQFFAAK